MSPSVSLFAAIFRVGRPLPPAAAAERSEGAGDRVARRVVEPRCSVAASIAASNGGSSRSGEGDAWSAAGPEGAGEEARVPVHQRPRTLRFELWRGAAWCVMLRRRLSCSRWPIFARGGYRATEPTTPQHSSRRECPGSGTIAGFVGRVGPTPLRLSRHSTAIAAGATRYDCRLVASRRPLVALPLY